jgi:hypothetical protein
VRSFTRPSEIRQGDAPRFVAWNFLVSLKSFVLSSNAQGPRMCNTQPNFKWSWARSVVYGPSTKVNLEYELVTREKLREVSTKIPGYKLHDSWRDVMAYLGCSRRTAFRKIMEGFRIPKEAYEVELVEP